MQISKIQILIILFEENSFCIATPHGISQKTNIMSVEPPASKYNHKSP